MKSFFFFFCNEHIKTKQWKDNHLWSLVATARLTRLFRLSTISWPCACICGYYHSHINRKIFKFKTNEHLSQNNNTDLFYKQQWIRPTGHCVSTLHFSESDYRFWNRTTTGKPSNSPKIHKELRNIINISLFLCGIDQRVTNLQKFSNYLS